MKTLDIALEEAERTGASMLCEGIETLDHLDYARAIGGDLGQGHFLGEPAPLRAEWENQARSWSLTTQPVPTVETPYDAVQGRATRTATEDVLHPLSRQMANETTLLSAPALAITLVPEPHLFDDDDRAHLVAMASRDVLTAALGPSLPTPQPMASAADRSRTVPWKDSGPYSR